MSDKDFDKLVSKQKTVCLIHFIVYNIICAALVSGSFYMGIGFVINHQISFLGSSLLFTVLFVKYISEYKSCPYFGFTK